MKIDDPEWGRGYWKEQNYGGLTPEKKNRLFSDVHFSHLEDYINHRTLLMKLLYIDLS